MLMYRAQEEKVIWGKGEKLYFLKKYFIYLFMRHTHTQRDRERERERQTQAEGEAGSMQGAQRGT